MSYGRNAISQRWLDSDTIVKLMVLHLICEMLDRWFLHTRIFVVYQYTVSYWSFVILEPGLGATQCRYDSVLDLFLFLKFHFIVLRGRGPHVGHSPVRGGLAPACTIVGSRPLVLTWSVPRSSIKATTIHLSTGLDLYASSNLTISRTGDPW